MNGFIGTLFLALLVQQGRLTESMSPWQAFVVLLDAIGVPALES